MSLTETIIKDVQALSESKQVEVLDFVQYLRSKAEIQGIKDWAEFSLSSAIRGMEDELSPYSLNDISVMTLAELTGRQHSIIKPT